MPNASSGSRAGNGGPAEAEALVAGAQRVMARKGFEATTVVDILAEAGLSTRAFYRHFAGKDELLLVLYERNAAKVAEALAARVAAAPTPPEALVAWVDEVLALAYDARRRPRTVVLAGEGVRLAAQHPVQFERIVEGMVAPLRATLAAGLASGDFPMAEPDTDARLIFSVATTVARVRLERPGPHRRDQARDHVLRFALAGVGAPSPFGGSGGADATPG